MLCSQKYFEACTPLPPHPSMDRMLLFFNSPPFNIKFLYLKPVYPCPNCQFVCFYIQLICIFFYWWNSIDSMLLCQLSWRSTRYEFLCCVQHTFSPLVMWYCLQFTGAQDLTWITFDIVRTLIPQEILHLTLGSRSFNLATQALWNSLLADVHAVIWHLMLLKATLRCFCLGLHFKKLFLT